MNSIGNPEEFIAVTVHSVFLLNLKTLKKEMIMFMLRLYILSIVFPIFLTGMAYGEFTLLPEARQTIYQQGVPHTNPSGVIRTEYVPGESFFPRSLYHPRLYDDLAGTRATRFGLIKLAGFNTIQTTGPLSESLFSELAIHQLQLSRTNARATEVCQYSDYFDQVLGWTIIDEPEMDGNWGAYPSRFQFFNNEREAIRQCDAITPCMVTTTAWISGQNRDWWIQWHQTCDISCHDSYPYDSLYGYSPANRPPSLSFFQGIPESMSLAVSVNNETKPAWLIVQAFEGGRWFYPTGDELRAMVYAGIVHGATGINYFTYDNHMPRDAGILGISPDPKENYGTGRIATADELNKIVGLWNDTARINQELIDLEPWLLSPTSSVVYAVSKQGNSITSTPIRSLLKSYRGEFRLIAVNVDRSAMQVRFDFSDSGVNLCKAERLYHNPEQIELASNVLEVTFAPMEVHVYRLFCCYPGDINGDCAVDINDLTLLADQWLK